MTGPGLVWGSASCCVRSCESRQADPARKMSSSTVTSQPGRRARTSSTSSWRCGVAGVRAEEPCIVDQDHVVRSAHLECRFDLPPDRRVGFAARGQPAGVVTVQPEYGGGGDRAGGGARGACRCPLPGWPHRDRPGIAARPSRQVGETARSSGDARSRARTAASMSPKNVPDSTNVCRSGEAQPRITSAFTERGGGGRCVRRHWRSAAASSKGWIRPKPGRGRRWYSTWGSSIVQHHISRSALAALDRTRRAGHHPLQPGWVPYGLRTGSVRPLGSARTLAATRCPIQSRRSRAPWTGWPLSVNSR